MEYWKHTNNIENTNMKSDMDINRAKSGMLNIATFVFSITTSIVASIAFIIVLISLIQNNNNNRILLQELKEETDAIETRIQKVSNEIGTSIQSGINTRLLTIQSHVQNYIPLALTQQTSNFREFINELIKKEEEKQSRVPIQRMVHDDGIEPLIPDKFWKCSSGNPTLISSPKIRLIPGPGWLATSTTINGCIRLPSLVINNLIYAYTSNLITKGCQDIGKSYQVLQIGIITINSDLVPDLNPRITHTFNINDNRKSCSLALLNADVYQLCSTPKVDERSDYASIGIEDLVLDIVTSEGIIITTRFTNDNITFDKPYAALYPSVGPGIHYNNRIIFLGYGGLEHEENEDVICNVTGCPGKTQADCNQASYSPWFSNRRMVNAIITIDRGINGKPNLRVWTIPMRQNYWGSEGRLLLLGDKIYIYTRSTSWHSKLQLGLIDISNYNNIRIRWTYHDVLSRPGSEECPWGNSCPRGCITGVYNDAYPLNPSGSVVASVILNSHTSRENPVITYSTDTSRVNELAIRNSTLSAAYTTTNCVTHYDKGYCFHIIEINHKSLNTLQPMLFKTEIPKSCN
ncbi:hemagglutinin-neuraminidase [Respirovirus rupicaprae]|uniref:Hemagglutinin-neuraminidase n=1 Tax=Respirovirus ChamoisRV/IT2014 TaxID=2730603 RepID=A0A6M3TXV3_9MONO|nr:hemagglutinin-neuraminidase [Respirovirus ChamoisRV/IT2014]